MAKERAPSITSFHGADGSGKTTLARVFAQTETLSNRPVQVIGGSSYKEWLTPKVAKETLGDDHILSHATASPRDKIRLYEDIAVACYGYAAHLVDSGVSVALDSDPILKRATWAKIENTDAEYDRYIKQFDERIYSKIPELTGLISTVVGVNVLGDVDETDLFSRIKARGSNSDFDPKDIREMHSLQRAAKQIWDEVFLASEGSKKAHSLFIRQFGAAACVTVMNPTCEPSDVSSNMQELAMKLSESTSYV